tara:strand:- start:9179 stop:9343 length:165 start_codon:yes stop_codon:yes gene_type:complete
VVADLQLIVLDHAHLTEYWFESAIVEEWLRGQFLVPPAWDTRRIRWWPDCARYK